MDDAFIYLAFGDSITSGNNVNRKERYPAILARQLERYTYSPVYLRNFGKSGLSSSGLLKILQSPNVLGVLRHAHLVTVCIGGDDLIYAYIKWRLFRNDAYLHKGILKFRRNYDKICHILSTVRSLQVVLSTFYNPFPNTQLAIDTVRYCNYRIIQPIAAGHGFPVADLYAAFSGREPQLLEHYRSGLLEEYLPFAPNSPIHPNEEGYRVIARVFGEQLFTF